MAEQTEQEKQEAYEKQREKDGIEIHLPRAPVTPVPDAGKKKTPEK